MQPNRKTRKDDIQEQIDWSLITHSEVIRSIDIPEHVVRPKKQQPQDRARRSWEIIKLRRRRVKRYKFTKGRTVVIKH